MSGILDMISQHVDQSTVNQLGNQIGADPSTTQRAIAAALPTLFGAMAQHASTPQGEQQVQSAVQSAPADGAAAPPSGGGLLQSLLGAHEQAAQQQVAQKAGIDTQQAAKVLMYLAPIAIAVLARKHAQQPQTGNQPGGLAGLIRGAEQSIQGATGPAGGGLGSVLGSLFG